MSDMLSGTFLFEFAEKYRLGNGDAKSDRSRPFSSLLEVVNVLKNSLGVIQILSKR